MNNFKPHQNRKLIHGVGINDVEYVIRKSVELPNEGVRRRKTIWTCPYYQKWVGILERCCSERFKEEHPTYMGCKIHDSWVRLSDFIKWVDSQPNKDWQNCEPDKDLLIRGNKCYGPETVVFTNHVVNSFVNSNRKGKYLLGVSFHEHNNKLRSRCRNPFNNKTVTVGYYDSEMEAHKAWQAKKHEYACQLAELQEDPRVADALRQRYAPDKDWTNE